MVSVTNTNPLRIREIELEHHPSAALGYCRPYWLFYHYGCCHSFKNEPTQRNELNEKCSKLIQGEAFHRKDGNVMDNCIIDRDDFGNAQLSLSALVSVGELESADQMMNETINV